MAAVLGPLTLAEAIQLAEWLLVSGPKVAANVKTMVANAKSAHANVIHVPQEHVALAIAVGARVVGVNEDNPDYAGGS